MRVSSMQRKPPRNAWEVHMKLTFFQASSCLLLGSALAVAYAYIGAALTPPAIARWTIQINDQEELRALFAMLGIRHLPIFLLSVLGGKVIFSLLKDTSRPMVALAVAPYIFYVVGTGILESLAARESAWRGVTYQPSYFIWPHFVSVPVGLLAAAGRVKRRNRLAAH